MDDEEKLEKAKELIEGVRSDWDFIEDDKLCIYLSTASDHVEMALGEIE